jgi:hypothetical protein
VGLLALFAYGCSGGGPSSGQGSPEPSYRVEDDLNDCYTRPESTEPQKVDCGDGVDIAAVEFRPGSITVESAKPIVVGDRPFEFTVAMDTDGGRLTLTATSSTEGKWDVECDLAGGDATPKPGDCSVRVDGSNLQVAISPFTLRGKVNVTLLDISYFRTESEGGVGDFLGSTVRFTLD